MEKAFPAKPPQQETPIQRPTYKLMEDKATLPFFQQAGETLDVAVIVLATEGQEYNEGDTSIIVPDGRVLLSLETSLIYEAAHRGIRDFYDLVNQLANQAKQSE